MGRSNRKFWRPSDRARRPIRDGRRDADAANRARRFELAVALRRSVGKARYGGWLFFADLAGDRGELEIYRPDPRNPRAVKREGPWPIPLESDEAAIRAIVVDAVVSIEGPKARGQVEWFEKK